ncbi:MAG: putative MFS family arabinose efflux permease [bacterium]|jgi:predicted MFS family arabinose efflux permease
MNTPAQPLPKSQKTYWFFLLPLFLLNIVVFLDHLMLVPLTTKIAETTGLPIIQGGLLIAVYPAAAAVSAFFLAPFSDRFGRKKMILLLSIGFAFATAGFTFSSNVFNLYLFRILSGIFGGPIIANTLAFIGDSFNIKQRTKAITTVILAFSIASIMGVPVGAWAGDHFAWQVPFIAIAIITIFCAFWIIFLEKVHTGAESGNILKQYVELINLWKIPKVRILFLIQFFMIFGLFGFVPNLSTWLSVNFGFSATQIGLCYMQGGIGGFIGNRISSYLLGKGYKENLMSIGAIILGATTFLATMEILPIAYSGALFAGIMFGGSLRMPPLQMLLTESVPIQIRGRLMSMSMIVSNITMGIGGLWSIPLLKLENNHLYGMSSIGAIAFLTSFFVPCCIFFLKKDNDKLQSSTC